MLKIVPDIFTYLLALYGALSLVISIIGSIRQRVNNGSAGVKLVLLVKDQEKTIEGIVRNVFTGDFLRKVMSKGKLVILDMGSTDETMDILKMLEDEYMFIDVLGQNERERVFERFDRDED